MVQKDTNIIMEGIIKKNHGKFFEVLINDKFTANLILKGKLKKSKIQFVEGDKVEVELNPIDPSKGYVTKRL